MAQWLRKRKDLWQLARRHARPVATFCFQAVAGVIVTTVFFASCGSARSLVFETSDSTLVGRVDELETSELKVGSISPVDIDGSGQHAIAVILIPRYSWLDALGSPELKAGTFRPDLPELVIAEQHGRRIQERYRFRPNPEGSSLPADAIRQLGVIPSLTIEDIDGDGRDEVFVKWDVIGATGILEFATITEYSDGRFRTLDPLPSSFAAAIPTYAKYSEFWINNDFSEERIYIHAAQDYQVGHGRVIVSVQGEAECMACESAFQVLLIKPFAGRGTGYEPLIYSSVIVPKPDSQSTNWNVWAQNWRDTVKRLAETRLP